MASATTCAAELVVSIVGPFGLERVPEDLSQGRAASLRARRAASSFRRNSSSPGGFGLSIGAGSALSARRSEVTTPQKGQRAGAQIPPRYVARDDWTRGCGTSGSGGGSESSVSSSSVAGAARTVGTARASRRLSSIIAMRGQRTLVSVTSTAHGSDSSRKLRSAIFSARTAIGSVTRCSSREVKPNKWFSSARLRRPAPSRTWADPALVAETSPYLLFWSFTIGTQRKRSSESLVMAWSVRGRRSWPSLQSA